MPAQYCSELPALQTSSPEFMLPFQIIII